MPVDPELARWLVSGEAADALAQASGQPDPGSLAAATALRRNWSPDQAAAVLSQAALRRKAVAKFGERAGSLFLTPDGLEQATRADVARWRAQRFVAAGVLEVVDLGCGIGADALAFLDAGLNVVAVDADPATAVLAEANLQLATRDAEIPGQARDDGEGPAGTARDTGAVLVSRHPGERRDLRTRAEDTTGKVLCGDAVDLADELLAEGAAVFADPARRTASGRTWRVADFSPPWDFATGLLEGRIGCLKAAPGLPSAFIPDGTATTWVSHRGDLVEASLWSGPWHPGSRAAVLLPAGDELDAGEHAEPPVGPVGSHLYEPNPAVIRAGAIGALAGRLDARVPQAGIAYLLADSFVATPFATAFEVLDELPIDERALRSWVHEQGVGTLEIKVRGLDVDPAVLRRRLKPKGRASATIVLTPTPYGARTLVVRRVVERPGSAR